MQRMKNRYVLDGGYIKDPKEHFKKILEELIEEEKQKKQEKNQKQTPAPSES